jgi:site-specific DNA-methyltransferase (adenine-specific)
VTPYYSDDHVTIYHGDCREVTEWLSADVLVTDPPYGMTLRSGWSGAMGDLAIAGDESTAARDDALALWAPKPALVFGRWSVARPHGTRMVLTWEKGEHVGMGDLALPWKPNTEEIYVLGSGFDGRRTGSVLRHLAVAGCVGKRNTGTRHHPTEKPVDLMRDLVGKCPLGVVADPFMGSGTTLRAAKDLGRRAIGIELDERYCEIAARRMGQEVLALQEAAQ